MPGDSSPTPATYSRRGRDPLRDRELRLRGMEGDRVPRALSRIDVQGRLPAGVRAATRRFGRSSSTSRSIVRPSEAQLRRYAAVLPPGFPVVSKVWEELTMPQVPGAAAPAWRTLPRHADAPAENPRYLDARVFREEVLPAYERAFAGHTGPFVLEFPTEWQPTLARRDAPSSRKLDRVPAEAPAQHSLRRRDPHAGLLRARVLRRPAPAATPRTSSTGGPGRRRSWSSGKRRSRCRRRSR